MSRTIHAQQSLKMDAEHKYCHMPDRTNFHTKFILFIFLFYFFVATY